jgi:gluconate kinase
LQEKVKHLYARVYNYLKAAKIIFNNLEQAYSTLANRRLIEAKTEEIIEDVFKGVKRRDKISLQRRMFASGITPEGSIHFLDELFDKVSKRFILVGNPGTGKSAVLKKIEELGTSKGLDMDIFYCPMNPQKIEHLLIKDLDIGFITSVRPHMILNTRENDVFIDMNSVLDCSRLKDIEEDISQDSLLAWSLFDKAVKTLIQVKQTRDELEGIYSSNMNFQVAEKVGEQILAKILSYI